TSYLNKDFKEYMKKTEYPFTVADESTVMVCEYGQNIFKQLLENRSRIALGPYSSITNKNPETGSIWGWTSNLENKKKQLFNGVILLHHLGHTDEETKRLGQFHQAEV